MVEQAHELPLQHSVIGSRQQDSGLLQSTQRKRTAMDLRELNVNITQNRHPWELSRAQFFRELVCKWVPPTDHEALDIGSGDAWLASRLGECLSDRSQLTCVD